MMMTQDIIQIPAGTLQMGSTTVHLDAFYMDIYPVTNAQFKTFVDTTPKWQKENIKDKYHDGNYLKNWEGTDYPAGKANHPVVYVSWYAAMAYARALGGQLPTNAEWEYAARGGLEGQPYPWGDAHPSLHAENWLSACLTTHFARERQRLGPDTDYQESLERFYPKNMPVVAPGESKPLPALANFFQLFGGTTPVGCFRGKTPVSCFPHNPFCLYDMTGNVWEWVLDAADEDVSASDDSRNPITGGKTRNWLRKKFTRIQTPRVSRGGGWRTPLEALPLAKATAACPPKAATDTLGFRCVFK